MDWSRYRFHSRWDLDAPPGEVYAALAAPEGYPLWWPQVREANRTGADRGTLRFRSLIPYDLTVTLDGAHEDSEARVLWIALHGDLEGWARWTVRDRGAGSLAVFDQDVVVRKALLRWLSVPGRPVFRANHALMMRAGRRGLRARLAAAGADRGPARGRGPYAV
ncbi:polyketide cyclase [Streptomyces sp. LX-29]|uniref:SRPBCC family protein n=1 Tax=Streptomyces sp. LX-29 TaxID=2900152 RepID=UPI00240E6FEA|nr:SRPBCC family protein [Streptomyces sp. LX-29]WFB06587.1 polyketide cyclase [Streptomyces sp. LX-29]